MTTTYTATVAIIDPDGNVLLTAAQATDTLAGLIEWGQMTRNDIKTPTEPLTVEKVYDFLTQAFSLHKIETLTEEEGSRSFRERRRKAHHRRRRIYPRSACEGARDSASQGHQVHDLHPARHRATARARRLCRGAGRYERAEDLCADVRHPGGKVRRRGSAGPEPLNTETKKSESF